MGLFDNIFLDKDTPTALLDNPEIKKPDGEAATQPPPYDPKNDPIAPVDTIPDITPSETKLEDISFDIGGDLDFGVTSNEPGGESSKNEEPQKIQETSEIKDILIVGQDIPPAETTNTGVSSIAMIQGGTASIIDSMDIGGTIDISPNTSTETKPQIPQDIHIEIHDIEEHQAGEISMIGNEDSGIYGIMNTGIQEKLNDTKEIIHRQVVGESPTQSIENISAEPFSEQNVTSGNDALSTIKETGSLPISSSSIAENTPTVETGENGGRIQDLISKLIIELRVIDEEEKRKKLEKERKIEDIEKREMLLEHEYTTRREALKNEKESLNKIDDKNAEKERINLLIQSFQADLG